MDATFWGVASVIVTAVFAGYGALWKIVVSRMKKTEDKLDNCESMHKIAEQENTKLAVKISRLEGKFETANIVGEVSGKIDTLTDLTGRVLNTLEKS